MGRVTVAPLPFPANLHVYMLKRAHIHTQTLISTSTGKPKFPLPPEEKKSRVRLPELGGIVYATTYRTDVEKPKHVTE